MASNKLVVAFLFSITSVGGGGGTAFKKIYMDLANCYSFSV